MLKLTDCPGAIEIVVGVIPRVKSKFWAGIAVKVTGTECVMAEGSLPIPAMLKLKACETLLETVTVKEAPAEGGTTLAGLTGQVGGAPLPQVRHTALIYPFAAI